jgi:hypothetical protein
MRLRVATASAVVITTPIAAGTVVGVCCFMTLVYVPPLRNVKEESACIYELGVRIIKSWPKRSSPPEIREFFVRMGKRGGASGGHARAANMTAEQRSESARKAVQARWRKVVTPKSSVSRKKRIDREQAAS